MKQFNKIFTLLFTFFLLVVIGCKSKPNDEEISKKISEKLQQDQGFASVNATVVDGVVTLTGNCEGEGCASRAEENVKAVEGVKNVENSIQSEEGTDLTLRTSVQSIISKYEGVQADVASGVIVLRGSINRNQVQPLMNELQALNPKKLDNQLAVRE